MAIDTQRRLFDSVRARLTLIVIACVVPLLLIAGHALKQAHDLRVDAERNANLELARAVGASFEGYVLDLVHTLGALGDGVLRSGYPPDAASQLLSEALVETPGIRHLSWVDPQGIVRASSEPRLIGQSLAHRAHFEKMRDGEMYSLSELLHSVVDTKPVFVVARSLRDEHGRLRAAFFAAVEPTAMARIIPAGRPQGGAVILVDSAGRVVFRSPAKDLRWEERLLGGREEVVDRALRGEEAVGVARSIGQGEELIAAAVPITNGWVAGASRSRAEVDGPALRQLARASALALLAVAVALGLSIALGRQVTHGLQRLEQHAETLGRGEHAAGDVEGPVELRRLGSAFTQMSERLLAARQQLERFARTADDQRRLFEMLLWEVPVGIVLIDPETLRARRANPAYLGFLDEPFRSGGIEDCEVAEFFPGAEEAGILEVLRRAAREQKPFAQHDYPYSGFARGEAWFYWGVQPIVSNGRTRDLLVVANEVTELVLARRSAEQATRTRDEVLSLVSHDLRTPLAAIQSGTSWLMRVVPSGASKPELVTQMLQRVDAAARRMGRLIADLVDLARLQEGRLAMEPAPHSPAELLRDAVDMVRGAAEEKGLAISWHASGELPAVRCDRDRVGQVLSNLLTNAVSATAAGTVHATAELVEGLVRFEVADTGPGVPEADLPGLFDRFRRGSAVRYEGSGLGLAIARALVEAQGGTIGVESVVGQGTRFHFTLPVADQTSSPTARISASALDRATTPGRSV